MEKGIMEFLIFILIAILFGLLLGIGIYKGWRWREADGVKLIMRNLPSPPDNKGRDIPENNDEYDFGHNVSHHTLDGEGDI